MFCKYTTQIGYQGSLFICTSAKGSLFSATIQYENCILNLNSVPAELVILYFLSFEDGIDNAISSFK